MNFYFEFLNTTWNDYHNFKMLKHEHIYYSGQFHYAPTHLLDPINSF